MLFNSQLLSRVQAKCRAKTGDLAYPAVLLRPDCLLFNHDREQYLHHWATIKRSNYLYTNGYEIRPASWLGYAFQTLKGWFGFKNYCAKAEVSMALQKLAFFGYLKQYNTPFKNDANFLKHKNYPFSDSFRSLVLMPLSDGTTQSLQNELIRYNTQHFRGALQVPKSFIYGETWEKLDLIEEIPALHPQNMTLINNTVMKLDSRPPFAYYVPPSSLYGKVAAKSYFQKALDQQKRWGYGFDLPGVGLAPAIAREALSKARQFDPEICEQHLECFIDFYIGFKDYRAAYVLIANRSVDIALKYLIQYKECQQFVSEKSPLGIALANHKQRSEGFAGIRNFAPQFEAHQPSRMFEYYVNQNQFEEAYQIFEQNPHIQILPAIRLKVSQHFTACGNEQQDRAFNIGKVCGPGADFWKDAEGAYLASISNMEKAYRLLPQTQQLEDLKLQKCRYGKFLLKWEKQTNELDQCDVRQVRKALNSVKEGLSENSPLYDHYLRQRAEGILRLAYYYISTEVAPHVRSLPKQPFDPAKFSQTIMLLNIIVKWLHGSENVHSLKVLAKAHYLLGSMKLSFPLPEIKLSSEEHSLLANKYDSSHPFCSLLRAPFVDEEERSKLFDKALPLLNSCGYSLKDKIFENRWLKVGNKVPIIDMCEFSPVKQEEFESAPSLRP